MSREGLCWGCRATGSPDDLCAGGSLEAGEGLSG